MIKSDVTEWLNDDVTIDFFKRIKALEEANEINVHAALSVDQLSPDTIYQAAMFNAALDQLKEVQDLPDQMKEDIEERRNEREENELGA